MIAHRVFIAMLLSSSFIGVVSCSSETSSGPKTEREVSMEACDSFALDLQLAGGKEKMDRRKTVREINRVFEKAAPVKPDSLIEFASNTLARVETKNDDAWKLGAESFIIACDKNNWSKDWKKKMKS